MKNEYGVKLDRSGYAPSVLNTEQGTCFICYKQTDTARHEIFFGTAYREKSKRLGAWVNLCPKCHDRVHIRDCLYNYELKRIGQHYLMEHYDWNVEDFRERFGKNYGEE